MRLLVLVAIYLLAAPAWAQSLRNESGAPLDLHGGPADWFAIVGQVPTGAALQVERCDLDGAWCLVSSEAGLGWIDMRLAARPEPLAPPPTVQVQPLPPPGEAIRPLPPAILDAVPQAVPGARPPMLLSVTEPVRNLSDGPIPLRTGPDAESPAISELRPGEGGLIDVCIPSEQWCRVTVPGGPTGWVEMIFMGLRRL